MEVKASDYKFANHLWVDDLFGRYGSRRAKRRIVAFAATPWLIGLVISSVAGHGQTYLGTGAFYLGFLGILVTTWTIHYGSTRHYKMYDRYLGCFDISDEKRLQLIRETIEGYSSLRNHWRAFFVSFALATGFIAIGFFCWDTVGYAAQQIGLTLVRPESFASNGWYNADSIVTGFTIVTVFSIFVFWPLGTAISVLGRMQLFMIRTSTLPTNLPPRLIKPLFNAATGFYTRISLVWTFGAFLFTLFFAGDEDWLSLAILISLFMSGLLLFIVPQVTYARVVASSEQTYFSRIISELEAKRQSTDEMMRAVSRYSEFFMSHDTWVYPLHQTYLVILAYVFSLVSLNEMGNFYKLITPAG